MATETAIDVVMPQMGVSVSEGTVTKWLKQEGEHIEADEPLLEISTDKVDTEVPSPASGTLTQILVLEGSTVEVGTPLARIGGAAGAPAPARRRAPSPRASLPRQSPSRQSPSRRLRSPLRPRRFRCSSRRRTARRSSPRSWRGSPPSTASTPARCRAPAAAAA